MRQPLPELMCDAVRQQFAELILALEALEQRESITAVVPLKEHVRPLRSLLGALDQLARLNPVEAKAPGAHRSVTALLKAAIGAIPSSHCDYYQYASVGDCGKLPADLHGTTDWMECALTALFKGMEACLPPRSRIHLTLHQEVHFVAIHARSAVASQAFGATSLESATGNSPALHWASSSHVPLAARIIDMHGGKLEVQEMDTAPAQQAYGIASFTLHLPTRGPLNLPAAACENCIIHQQAEAYARDLVALMPIVPAEAKVSDEERALLAAIGTHC